MLRIEADVLIPGRGDPIRNAALIVDGPTIAYAGPIEGAPSAAGATVVNVPALMPGMWDVHGRFMGIRTLNVEEIARTPLAVLAARANVNLYGAHVYASAVGGVRVSEPAIDLAVALALVSIDSNKAVPDDLIVCGEVGLAGEVRQVPLIGRRLQEAARLGFKRAVVPASTPDTVRGIELLRANSVSQAMELTGLGQQCTK